MDLNTFLHKGRVGSIMLRSPVSVEHLAGSIEQRYRNRTHILPLELGHELQREWPDRLGNIMLRDELINIINSGKNALLLSASSQKSSEKNYGKMILINSMPRAGNSLLNQLISRTYNIESTAAHRLSHVRMPHGKDIVVQVHAFPNKHLERFMVDSRAQLVTILRHPLDVAISMLHFSSFEQQTQYWIDGHHLKIHIVRGYPPNSKQFQNWLLSRNFEKLLEAAHSLWLRQDIARIRFEDLIQNPHNSFHGLTLKLNNLEAKSLDDIKYVTDSVMPSSFVGAINAHRWRGQVNNWKRYISERQLEKLSHKYGELFNSLGYDIQGPFVTEEEAILNWRSDF